MVQTIIEVLYDRFPEKQMEIVDETHHHNL